MASKKEQTVPDGISEAVSAIAKGIGVAATELWSIFVRQYFVRGVTEVFTGGVLCAASYFLSSHIGLWVLVPLAAALLFFYDAILYLGNPKYYALEDITKRIQDFKSKQEEKEEREREREYYR